MKNLLFIVAKRKRRIAHRTQMCECAAGLCCCVCVHECAAEHTVCSHARHGEHHRYEKSYTHPHWQASKSNKKNSDMWSLDTYLIEIINSVWIIVLVWNISIFILFYLSIFFVWNYRINSDTHAPTFSDICMYTVQYAFMIRSITKSINFTYFSSRINKKNWTHDNKSNNWFSSDGAKKLIFELCFLCLQRNVWSRMNSNIDMPLRMHRVSKLIIHNTSEFCGNESIFDRINSIFIKCKSFQTPQNCKNIQRDENSARAANRQIKIARISGKCSTFAINWKVFTHRHERAKQAYGTYLIWLCFVVVRIGENFWSNYRIEFSEQIFLANPSK